MSTISSTESYLSSFLLVICLSFVCTVSTNTSFTVVSDKMFEKQLLGNRNNENLEAWNRNVTIIFLEQNKSSIRDFLGLKEAYDRSNVYFLFAKRGAFLEKLLNDVSKGMIFFNFETSEHNMNKISNVDNEDCLDHSDDLQRSLIAITYNLFLQDVGILTDDHECNKNFSDIFKSMLLHHGNKRQLSLKLNHMKFDPDHRPMKSIENDFYDLKTTGVSLIILLASPNNAVDIFKVAQKFGLLSEHHLWLTPNLNEFSCTSLLPSRTLIFKIDRNLSSTPYTNLASTLSEFVNSYSEVSLQCKTSSFSITFDCMMTIFYRNLLANEQKNREQKLHLVVSYKDLTEVNSWLNASVIVDGDVFTSNDYDGALFKKIFKVEKKEDNDHPIRVVTVIDEPYTLENKQKYNHALGVCTMGVLCRKPITTSSECGKNESDKTAYEITCCLGYVIELFEILINELNLNVEMYITDDNKYGAMHEGKWNGLIGDVAYGKADLAVAGLSITKERSKVVDFTLPWIDIEVGVLVRPQAIHLDFVNFEFVAPLRRDLQASLWVTIFLFTIALFVFENCTYAVSVTPQQEDYYSCYESLSYISGVTLQRDLGGVNPVRPGSRVAAVVFAFGMVIVTTTYTAFLVEQGVRNENNDLFLGSSDSRMRNPTPSFKFATVKSSSHESFFVNSKVDDFERISKFMDKYNVESTSDAIFKINKGTLDAFFYDYDVLVWYMSRDRSCTLRAKKDALIPSSGLGFAMRKNFRWLTNINQAILRHRESDKVLALHNKWFYVCDCHQANELKTQLGINNFGGLLLLLIAAVFLCVALLIPEYVYMKHFGDRLSVRIIRLFSSKQELDVTVKPEIPKVYTVEKHDEEKPTKDCECFDLVEHS